MGELGSEPVESEMFDLGAFDNAQIALLANETVYLPFTFLTLIPYQEHVPDQTKLNKIAVSRSDMDAKITSDSKSPSRDSAPMDTKRFTDDPKRTAVVKIVSATHGHIVSMLQVGIHHRSFAIDRTIRFYEPENSVMKKRIQYMGHINNALAGERSHTTLKFVHCVESSNLSPSKNGEVSRVVVEWGVNDESFSGHGALELILRFKCSSFPNSGSFFLLIYNDPFQCELHEVRLISRGD